MKIASLLQTVGLTGKESGIYMALIENGPLKVADISRKAGMHRPIVYQTLPSLQEKGLVTMAVTGKQKRYAAESPEKLAALFEKMKADFQSAIPDLQSAYQSKNARPLVKFFEGKNGLRFVFEDLVTSLKRGDVFYRYSSAKDSSKNEKYLPKNYRAIRDQKQLERFVITSEAVHKLKKPRLERATKTVPVQSGLFDYDVTQLIYGTKVAFVDYNSETALIIENSSIAEFQKKIFKLLYGKL